MAGRCKHLDTRHPWGVVPTPLGQSVYAANTGLAYDLVYKWVAARPDLVPALDDMVQEALLGLFEAVLRWDAAKGLRFATYAHPFIRGRLLSWHSRHRETQAAEYTNQFGRVPDEHGDDGFSGQSEPVDHRGPEDGGVPELREQCEALLAHLPRRLRLVVELKFRHRMTLEQIGTRFGLTKERARQMIVEGLALARQGAGQ